MRKMAIAAMAAVFVVHAFVLVAAPVGAAAPGPVVAVPCRTDALIHALQTTRGGGILSLSPHCTYPLSPARTFDDGNGLDGLPVIDNTLAIVGNGATLGGCMNNYVICNRVVEIGAQGSLTMTDLTVTKGYASSGGAIFNSGSLRLEAVTVSNSAAGRGGGIFNSGALVMTGGSIDSNDTNAQNFAVSNGGGIYNAGVLTLDGIDVVGNYSLSNNSAAHGAGIYNTGMLELNDDHIEGNISYYGTGGGIANFGPGAKVRMQNTVVNGNGAQPSPLYLRNGGGIENEAGTITIINSAILQNSAGLGAGVYSGGGNVNIIRSLVSENVADQQGGGIFGTVTLSYSLVVQNHPNDCYPYSRGCGLP